MESAQGTSLKAIKNMIKNMESLNKSFQWLEQAFNKLNKAIQIPNPDKKLESVENIKIPAFGGLRSNNSKTEVKRLKYLQENPEKIFDKLKSLNPPIYAVEIEVVGGRKSSFDFKVTDIGGKMWTIEHKGFTCHCDIQIGAPWINTTPQFVNCPGSKIDLSKEFAHDWFLNTIPLLKQHYDIKTQIPSFEKFEKDIYKDQPTDLFMMELKNKIKKDKAFADEHWKRSHKIFVENYLKNDEKYVLLKKTILTIIEEKLSKKDIWLNIQYPSAECIEPDWDKYIWSLSDVPSITSFKIEQTPKITKAAATIQYSYTTNIGGEKIYEGHARMRFRNQIGFNLSWNLS